MAEIPSIRRGDTLSYSLTLTDVDGNPIPANGVLTFTVKVSPEDPDPGMLQHSVLRMDDNVFAPDGRIVIEIPASKTKLLIPGDWYYDMQFVTASGFVQTIVPSPDEEQTVTVLPDITLTDH